jgi:hypothetical protein
MAGVSSQKEPLSLTVRHPDRTGEGRAMKLIASWLGDGEDVRTKLFKASNLYDLLIYGYVHWVLVLRPDLALLNASDAIELDRIITKYVN